MIDIDEIWDGAVNSISSKTADDKNSLFREVVKMETGKEYLFHIVPYLKEGKEGLKKTFFKRIVYSWASTTGNKRRYYCLSPRTFGEKCPINEYGLDIKGNQGEDAFKLFTKKVTYNVKTYVNVYVVKDPSNPENEGKVKILDMASVLSRKLEKALNKELDEHYTELANASNDSDQKIVIEVGKKILDLTNKGMNLLVKVKESDNGVTKNDYSESEFTFRGAKLNLSEESIQNIYDSAYDLTEIDRVFTYDELNEMFTRTYLNKPIGKPKGEDVVVKGESPKDWEDDILKDSDDDIPFGNGRGDSNNSVVGMDDIEDLLQEMEIDGN